MTAEFSATTPPNRQQAAPRGLVAQAPTSNLPSVAPDPPGVSPRDSGPNPNPGATPAARVPVIDQPGYPPTPPDAAGNCSSSAPIKAAENGRYHAPGEANYDRAKAKQCFVTPEAAQGAGFRPAKRPAKRSKPHR